ncbi:MAG: AmmeMemoRadiSam system protein B [Patescibacteria group bacterium]
MKRITALFFCFLILPGCGSVKFNARETNAVVASPGNNNTEERIINAPDLPAIPNNAELYDALFTQAEDIGDIGIIKGAITPHHLVGGNIPATLFKYLGKQKPSVIVVFGPDHYQVGGAPVVSAIADWATPYGKVKVEENILQKLYGANLMKDNYNAFTNEHSIGALVSFIAKFCPDSKIVPIIFPYTAPTSTVDNFLQTLWLLLPDDAVFVASIDFSHYQNPAMAEFHDELNRAVIKNFEYNRFQNMEIDSTPSLYALLKSMEKNGTQKISYEMSGSSDKRMNNPAVEETTSYYAPFFVAGDKNEDRVSSILFFGDLMLDRSVKTQIDKYGTDYIFTKLAGQENRFFMGTDVVHANLEGPFADSRRATSKEIAFRFDPKLLSMLQKYNFGMFSQANNHSLDMSSAGFEESKVNLRKYGFGVYGSQYRVDNESMLIQKVGDYNIAFIGLNDTNSPIDLPKTKELIKKGNDDADFVVINIHWGPEYKEFAVSREQTLGHELVDAGADVIIGHHAHVVQEMEIYKNRPIFYSLGNFVFDQYFSTPTQQGLGIGIILRRDSITIYPTALEQNKSQVSQMPYAERTKYLSDWIAKSRLGDYKFEDNKIIINTN